MSRVLSERNHLLCKQCQQEIGGSGFAVTTWELQVCDHWANPVGNSADRLLDAGVFCSAACLAAYLTEPKAAKAAGVEASQ